MRSHSHINVVHQMTGAIFHSRMIWWTWEEIWVKRYVDRNGYESEYEDTIADLSNDLGSSQRHRGWADDHDIRSIFVFDAWRLISLSTSPRDF